MTGRPLPVTAAQLAQHLKSTTAVLADATRRITDPIALGQVRAIVETSQVLLRRFEGKP